MINSDQPSNDNLKLCPFCGGTPIVRDAFGSGNFTIECERCGAEIGDTDIESASKLWNDRYLGEWTTEPPTEPGWYWARTPEDRIVIVDVFETMSKRLIAGEVLAMNHTELSYFTHWLGPIPEPTPPG